MDLVTLAFVVLAQAGPPSSARDAVPMAPATQRFMQEAATGGLAEVELGQMASTKASSPQVRQFAARMVKDHGAANDELLSLAKTKGVSLSTQLDDRRRSTIARLRNLSGPTFEREYLHQMVKDHREDVSRFEHEAGSDPDADLKAFAQRTLPIVRQHLELAETAQRSVGRK